jgi:hypothetical protein
MTSSPAASPAACRSRAPRTTPWPTLEIPYCGYCAPEGNLPPRDERLERFTQWTMRQDGLDYQAAREKAIAYMKTMPAWKDAF